MFFQGMPQPSDTSGVAHIFCGVSSPGCRQMVLVNNPAAALAAEKIVVAEQLWRRKKGRWECDRCAGAGP